MKKFLFLAVMALACVNASAQLTTEEYKAKYERQVRNVGYDGVGVETILDNWEVVAPDDPDMLLGRFNYYLFKSQSTEMVPMARSKYLGKAPALTLKDEAGNPVNYFEDTLYDDACFGEALKVIDELIRQHPYELNFHFIKAANLMSYEKEDPYLAYMEIGDLISMHSSRKPGWQYLGEDVSADIFAEFVQQYCAAFFEVGSEASYEYFKELSVRMSKLFPKHTGFIDNQGSYYLVCQRNFKKAISFYDKALKIDPEDQVALRNKKIAQRQIDIEKKNGKKK